MTIHYHGTPITPRLELLKLKGKHFCVPFSDHRDDNICMRIGQSVLWDNGAFNAFTKGSVVDEPALYQWLGDRLQHPHRAIILDKIGGSVAEQREFRKRWPFDVSVSLPVWHLDKPLDYLKELAEHYPSLALGSAGDFWEIGSKVWRDRMDETYTFLKRLSAKPWIHGLRMAAMAGERWPLASVDSANVARNFKGSASQRRQDIKLMAERIDTIQAPSEFFPPLKRIRLFP